MCVHPGPLGTGLLCRMNQTTLEPTGQSCCGEGGPCQLPTEEPQLYKCVNNQCQKTVSGGVPLDTCNKACSVSTSVMPDHGATDSSGWPGACCAGGNCSNCPGGSPLS